MLLQPLLLPFAYLPMGVPASRPAALARLACAPFMQVAEVIEPPLMESSCGFDFVPLLTALQTGEWREADQLTRDALIKLAGSAAVARGYVYFTEAPNLPEEDMATIERLWRAYSGNKFGYSVQRDVFNSKKVGRNFEKLFERIGWKNPDGTLLRWLPEAKSDEFIYDVEKAVPGHLPLTSTLRGTQLLQRLMDHKAWERDEFTSS
ncbi:hypothetical protein AB1Y20_009317 [Prymnesium parvum]|uniref:GUN4-like domain-containing protein n=1 Tax=Prymnesium parvum TaxID=97485 RepID=A0AB34K149_PRYPA